MVSLMCLSSQLGRPRLGLGPPPRGLSLSTWHLVLQALLSCWTASTSPCGFQGDRSQDLRWLGQAPFQRVCFLWSGVQPGTKNFSLSKCFFWKVTKAENPSSAPPTPRAVYRPGAKAALCLLESQNPSKQNALVFVGPELSLNDSKSA